MWRGQDRGRLSCGWACMGCVGGCMQNGGYLMCVWGVCMQNGGYLKDKFAVEERGWSGVVDEMDQASVCMVRVHACVTQPS